VPADSVVDEPDVDDSDASSDCFGSSDDDDSVEVCDVVSGDVSVDVSVEDSVVFEGDVDEEVEDSLFGAAELVEVSDGVDDDGAGAALVVTGVDVVGLLVADVTGASR
jgi:hypothetical protein